MKVNNARADLLYELEQIVDKLNDEAYESLGELNDFSPFALYSNGTERVVLLMERPLWSSEDDNRKELPGGDLEPLEPFLRLAAKAILDHLGKLLVKI